MCRVKRRQIEVCFSPNVILCGRLGSKYQLSDLLSPNMRISHSAGGHTPETIYQTLTLSYLPNHFRVTPEAGLQFWHVHATDKLLLGVGGLHVHCMVSGENWVDHKWSLKVLVCRIIVIDFMHIVSVP